ncbi:MAG: glycosyltransferase [Chitinophagales bacterium]|nr:glycosyltransferase [Chitinophagales bacterium]
MIYYFWRPKIKELEGLLIILVIVVFIQIFYYLFFFARLSAHNSSAAVHDIQPVSVVICARNEASLLEKNLTAILEQNYPHFEVVVVNDNSNDDTQLLLMSMAKKYPHLIIRRLVQHSKSMKGKKYPLTIGIRAATHECILVTDADCMPSSKMWIHHMAGMLTDKKEIVLGYAPYKKYKSFLNKFIRYETFMTALQYFSYALSGLTYMGTGRNMGYRKSLFFHHNAFQKYPHLLSGDDDLLINEAATAKNVSVQIDKDSFIYSEPKKNWDEYWAQKQRHVSTSVYYKLKHQSLLFLFSVSHLLFYSFIILVLFFTNYQLQALILFVTRFIIQAGLLLPLMKKLGEGDLFWYFPVMDIMFSFYYLKLLPGVIQTKSAVWK